MTMKIPLEDAAPSVAFEDAVYFVFNALREIPDFRDPRGRQIEFHGVLALAVLAMTAGHTSYRAVETWGKLREDTLIPLLGLVRAPSDSTIRRIVQGVDAERLRGVLRDSGRMLRAERTRLVTGTDGKTSRAARIENRRSAHIVSTVELNTGIIMDAEYCRPGEGELAASRRLDPPRSARPSGARRREGPKSSPKRPMRSTRTRPTPRAPSARAGTTS